MTTSIGVSIYPDDGLDAETLIKNADTAMYQAKENGHQSYQFFRPAMNVRAVERQSIEEHLRRALERQEFKLYYQPKINLTTAAITGVEALIRWTHPTRGSGSPVAVHSSRGRQRPHSAHRRVGPARGVRASSGLGGCRFALHELGRQRFRDAVSGERELFGKYFRNPRRNWSRSWISWELELTESALYGSAPSRPVRSLVNLEGKAGYAWLSDDFGTGYSSLSYLRKFPLDALKIDESFVRQIATIPDDTTIVRAIISMGRSLNLAGHYWCGNARSARLS